MNNLFSMDNGFFTVLSKICDIMFLSVIWALLCIPIITIGPASAALYYATVKVIRRERGYLFREFFKSFRMNFKRAAIVGVILTLLFAILIFDLTITWSSVTIESNMRSIMFGIFVAITFLLLCFTIYVFPILSRFDMTVKQLIKAAAFMSMKHLPSTIGMVIVTTAAIVGVSFVPILVFALPATAVYINSFSMERVLKKYMPKTEDSVENTNVDKWYME